MKVENGHKDNLDQLIRSKLDQLRPTAPVGSWEQLEQRLDSVENTAAFDEAVAEKAQNINAPYQPSSWAQLAARLELERQRFQAVLYHKVMEISLLLLLAMTVWQYLPEGLPTPIILTVTEQPIASVNTGQVNELSTTPLSFELPSQNAIGANIESHSTTSETLDNGIVEDLEHTNSSFTRLVKENSQKSLTDRPDVTTIPTLPSTTPRAIDPISTEEDQLLLYQQQQTEELLASVEQFRETEILLELSDEEINLLDYEDAEEMRQYLRPARRKNFLRVGFVGSPDYNVVVTPSQRISVEQLDGTFEKDIDDIVRPAFGYSGGITLGWEHNGKWEVETGAQYALRSFETIEVNVLTGSVADDYNLIGLDRIELNTITIPLNFRFNIFLQDKWRIYTQAGASLNLIASANYFVSNQLKSSTANPRFSRNPDIEKPSILNADSFTDGWLEGGSFRENVTIYADFAVGIERYINPRLSLFVQPTYRHGLPLPEQQSIGPFQDRLHSFQFSTGLKIRI